MKVGLLAPLGSAARGVGEEADAKEGDGEEEEVREEHFGGLDWIGLVGVGVGVDGMGCDGWKDEVGRRNVLPRLGSRLVNWMQQSLVWALF